MGAVKYASFGAARGFLGDVFHQNIVDVDGKVIAVLLNRRDGDYDDGLVARPLASLRPS